MGKRARRTSVLAMFAVAGVVILLVAEHFAESLVETGTELGVSEFLLVQWLAPSPRRRRSCWWWPCTPGG